MENFKDYVEENESILNYIYKGLIFFEYERD